MTDQKPPPVIPIGPQPNDKAYRETCAAGLTAIIKILNDLPDSAVLPVVCSVVMTLCANQANPFATFGTIGSSVARGLADIEQMPAGHA